MGAIIKASIGSLESKYAYCWLECILVEIRYKDKRLKAVPNQVVRKNIPIVVNLCQSLMYVPCGVDENLPARTGRTPPSLKYGL